MKKIDFQHFHGCPNGPELLRRVKQVIAENDLEASLNEVIVDTPDLAVRHSFRGSPTLLIDGKDFEGIEAPLDPKLSCRLYAGGLPTVEEILERLK